jgi:hypothetical protein
MSNQEDLDLEDVVTVEPTWLLCHQCWTSVDLCTHHPNKHAEPTMLWGEVPKAAVLCVRNGLKKKEKMCAERIELKLLEKIQDPFSEKSRVLLISPREVLWILMIHWGTYYCCLLLSNNLKRELNRRLTYYCCRCGKFCLDLIYWWCSPIRMFQRPRTLSSVIHTPRVAVVSNYGESWRRWINTAIRHGWECHCNTHVSIVVRLTVPKVLGNLRHYSGETLQVVQVCDLETTTYVSVGTQNHQLETWWHWTRVLNTVWVLTGGLITSDSWNTNTVVVVSCKTR